MRRICITGAAGFIGSSLVDDLQRGPLQMGRDAKIERHPVPQGDVKRTWSDLTLARDLPGYEPRTTLEDGLRQFIGWLR